MTKPPISAENTTVVIAAAEPPPAGPDLSMSSRILRKLVFDRWVLGPLALAVCLLPLSRFLGVRLLPIEAGLIFFPMLRFAWRLFFKYDSIEAEAIADQRWFEFLKRENDLVSVAARLDHLSVPAGRWLRALRQIYWRFRNDRDAGLLRDVSEEIADMVDRLYDALIARFLAAAEAIEVGQTVGGEVRDRLQHTLEQDWREIEGALDTLSHVIVDLRRSGHKPSHQLDSLQSVLDAQLRIAKATQQRVASIMKDAELEI